MAVAEWNPALYIDPCALNLQALTQQLELLHRQQTLWLRVKVGMLAAQTHHLRGEVAAAQAALDSAKRAAEGVGAREVELLATQLQRERDLAGLVSDLTQASPCLGAVAHSFCAHCMPRV